MEIIDRIKRCKNDEQLYYLTKRLIKDAVNKSRGVNPYYGLIGEQLEVNPSEYHFDLDLDSSYEDVLSVDIWNGYIPKGTKLVYGGCYNADSKIAYNAGEYYYIDDESYVYDFIKQLRDYEINDLYDLIILISNFMDNLFNNQFNPNNISREDMHRVLFKNEFRFFEPIKEHSITDFYHRGNAKCTEEALVANNLLSVLGIHSTFVSDSDHVYNIVFQPKDEEDETLEDYNAYILDFCKCVPVEDIRGNLLKYIPYFKQLDGGELYVDKMFKEHSIITLPSYDAFTINGSLYSIDNGLERHYGLRDQYVYDNEEGRMVITDSNKPMKKAKILL